MKNVLTIVAILFALAALTIPVEAATCGNRAVILAQLATKYQEAPVGLGVSNGGDLMELLISADGTTWTILQTRPNGPTCMVAAGENWIGKGTALGQGS